MRYLMWKKQIRKIYKDIESELIIDKLKLNLPKEHRIGVHVIPRLKIIIIPINHMKKIRRDNNYKYSLIDITRTFICHELGHFIQYTRNKEENLKRKKERIDFLIKGLEYENGYTIEQKIEFLKKHKELNYYHEKEAWDIGLTYFKSDEKLYMLMKKQSLKTHEGYINLQIKNKEREKELIE